MIERACEYEVRATIYTGQRQQSMKLGILKTDAVRPEWVPEYGEYPDMFVALLGQVDPELEFTVYDVEQGESREEKKGGFHEG